MIITDSIRRYIGIGITLFVIIGLIVANFMGKSQDKVFAENAQNYGELVKALQESNFNYAVEKSSVLEKHYNDSEMYNYFTGLALANAGEIEKSVRHFQRALDINPHKVEDSMFMLQYAEILISVDKLEEAREVLERCTSLATPETFPQYQERVAQLLEQISEQS